MIKRFFKTKIGRIISIFVILVVFVVLISIFSSNKLLSVVTVEAGSKKLDASLFIKDSKYSGIFVTDLSEINMSVPGTYNIKIQIGKRIYSSKLEVKDTTSPTAEVKDNEIWLNEKLEAKDFVENIVDATDVKVSFKEEPDFSKAGVIEVLILLEDLSGNKTELKAVLKIKQDDEPPQINGAKDQTVYIGDTISYRKGVTVTDNKDTNVVLNVDSSAVNLKKVGSYKVIYSAVDSSKNKAEKIVTINVKEKPVNIFNPEELHSLADKVLSSIITNGMTEKEKAWAIFKWVNTHITYIGYSDKSDWMKGAYQGIKKGTGDCFTYYAVSRELLTRAGFQNMCVVRVGGKTQHFWNLVYCCGAWYHFDAGKHSKDYPFTCFLRTDAEVEEYSKLRIGYYNFDKTKYPRTPLEPLK